MINALTLYAFYLSKRDKGPWWDIGKYFAGNDFVTTGLTISTAFTVLVFAGSALLLIIAGICYIPLLAHIQGNLKVCLPLHTCKLARWFSYYTRNTVATK